MVQYPRWNCSRALLPNVTCNPATDGRVDTPMHSNPHCCYPNTVTGNFCITKLVLHCRFRREEPKNNIMGFCTAIFFNLFQLVSGIIHRLPPADNFKRCAFFSAGSSAGFILAVSNLLSLRKSQPYNPFRHKGALGWYHPYQHLLL